MRSPMRSLTRAAVVGLSAAVLVSPAAALAAPTAHHAAKKHKKKKHKKSKRGKRGPRGLRGLPGAQGPQGPVGPQGAPGNTSVLHYRTTIATAGAAPMATAANPNTGSPANGNTVVLATFGPFTLTGNCFQTQSRNTNTGAVTTTTNAVTFLTTSQAGSSVSDGAGSGTNLSGTFNPGNAVLVGNPAMSVAPGNSPNYADDGGTASAYSGDGNTAATFTPTDGTFLRGPAGPACSFTGTVSLQ